jgi:hypothetical protein
MHAREQTNSLAEHALLGILCVRQRGVGAVLLTVRISCAFSVSVQHVRKAVTNTPGRGPQLISHGVGCCTANRHLVIILQVEYC